MAFPPKGSASHAGKMGVHSYTWFLAVKTVTAHNSGLSFPELFKKKRKDNATLMTMEGYRQDQSLSVATVHHQRRVDAQSHNGHEVTWGEQHRGHLANVTLLHWNTETDRGCGRKGFCCS